MIRRVRGGGRAALLGALVLALVGTGLLRGEPRATRPPPTVLPGPPPLESPGPVHRSAFDGERAWRVSLESEGWFDLGRMERAAAPGAGAAHPEDRVDTWLRFEGTLRLRSSGGQEGVQRIAARLEEASLRTAEGEGDPGWFDLPATFTLDREGRIAGMRWAASPPECVGGVWRSILDGLQVVIPAGAGSAWIAEQEYAEGTFRTRWGAAPGVGAGDWTLTGERLSCTSPAARVAMPDMKVLVRKSLATVRLSAALPWIASMDSVEVLEIRSRGAALARGRTMLRLTPATGDGASAVPGVEEAAALLAADGILASLPVDRALAARVRGLSPAQLVEAFLGAHGRADGLDADVVLTWLRDRPDKAESFAAWLRRHGGDLDPDDEVALWGLLARAGTPEARSTVLAALEDEGLSDGVRYRALAAVGDLVGADGGALDRLWSVVRTHAAGESQLDGDLWSCGLYAIGALGASPTAVDGLRETAGGELAAVLLGEERPAAQAVLIAALGNLGDPAILPALDPFFRSPDPNVRAEAIFAFRLMRGDGPEGALIARYCAESVPSIRAKAAETLAGMDPGPRTVAWAREEVLRTREEPSRIALVRLLGSASPGDPETEAALRDLLPTASFAVRREIHELLLARRTGR